MGNPAQHRQKAERIGEFLDAIDGTGHREWVAIAIFYRALHRVEEMFAAKGGRTTPHADRRKRLKSETPEILRQYAPLYNFSILCRYRFQEVGTDDVERLKARSEQLDHYVQLEIDEG